LRLSAEFDSRADQIAYVIVSAGAAGLSYYHARRFFLPFMGAAGAAATPLLLDAVVFWLASASIRQARAGRPLPMLRAGAGALLALTVAANALGGATLAQRVFLALPAALFGFLTEARTRLALYAHRAEHGDQRIRARLWLRHPVRATRVWLWLARQAAPAFDLAAADDDRLRAARHAVTVALPGRTRAARAARAVVLRELTAGRLTAAAAVEASGLLTRPGVAALHRAALAVSLGGARRAPGDADTALPGQPDAAPDADGPPDRFPDTARPSRRTGKGSTAAAVARLRDRHPAMTAAGISKRLGVSERTVRRHLAARSDAPPRARPGAVASAPMSKPADTARPGGQPQGHIR
jgi:hypothetical protein